MSTRSGRVAERLLGPGYDTGAIHTLRDLRQAVEAGLEVDALERVTEYLAPDPAEAARLRYAIVARTTLRRRARLTPEESERTARLARIVVLAEDAWESRELAREFLLSPQAQLGDETPVALALTELGAREVEELLLHLEHGLPA